MAKTIVSYSAVAFVLILIGNPVLAEYQITPDVVYGRKAGMMLSYDVIQNPERTNGATVMFMASMGWFSGWSPPEGYVAEKVHDGFEHFPQLVEKGYTLVIVRHGSAPWFKVPDAVADVRLAIRHFKLKAGDFGVDPDRIGIIGGSAGGHLALMLGTSSDDGDQEAKQPVGKVSSRVAAVVAYYPPVDLRKRVGPSEQFPALDFDEELADDVSPLLFVTSDDAPTLLIHGREDWLVTPDNSEKIHDALQKSGVTSKLIMYEKVGHAFGGKEGHEASAELIAWFEEHLKKKEPADTDQEAAVAQ